MSATPPMAARAGSRDRTPELTSKREKRHREDDDDDRDRSRRHRHDDRERSERGERTRDRERDRDDRSERTRDRDYRDRERDRGDRDRDYDRRDRDRDDRRRYDSDEERERDERRRRRHDRDDRDYDRRDRDRDRERERGRDRDHEREHERGTSRASGGDRDRGSERNGRGRERGRSPSPTPSHTRSQHSKARSRSRDRSRDRLDREREERRARAREERERSRERRDREMRDERRAARGGDYRSPRPRRSGRDDADNLLDEVDAELRSVFVSQIASRLSSNDLGLFFEDKLGRGTVRHARIIMDRGARMSKGVGYVELSSPELVNRAIALTGTVVMGMPIAVGLTPADREGIDLSTILTQLRGERRERARHRFPPLSTGLIFPPGYDPEAHAGAAIPYHRVYITNLQEDLTKEDLRQVFEPFGDIEFVDLHRDIVGNSKGTAYIQFRELGSAQLALDAMDGFELADKKIKAQPVEEKQAQRAERIEERRGGRLDAAGRMDLMYKLARTEPPGGSSTPKPAAQPKPAPAARPTHFLLVNNMFNPDEETERNWDLELAADVKGEVENKYGRVARIKVDKMSNKGDVYIEFNDVDGAERAQQGLAGRFFGGRKLGAQYISEGLFKAHF